MNDESYLDSFTHASGGYPSPDVEAIGARIVPAHFDHARDATVALRPGDVDDEMNGQRDGFADAAMRKPDVGGQDAVRQARQRLLGGVRVNRAEAAEMAGVERLQQVERLGAAHLADEDAIGSVSKRRAQQVGDGDRRQRRFLSERHLRATRLEPQQVRLVEMNLGRLLDDDDAVAVRNVRRQRIEQRRLAGAGPARDQDVLLRRDGVGQLRRERRRQRARRRPGRRGCSGA